ncbi:gibberellin 2-beta-dioxygenase 8-like [Senna tora]|uniref:Gibberellin 2-beta-dioxygenase 8-like n=1 Tax=Senna tora TaxID=362788 RepID=A0A834TKM5_9FABA|nr:gibberellin 2-beta-dioxygenase 8-like [Senna tora]
MDYEPPFLETYKTLLSVHHGDTRNDDDEISMVEERCDIPLIDVGRLDDEECKKQIIEAAKTWGFFQIVNHGIPQNILHSLMFEEMIDLFHRPFAVKSQEKFNNFLSASGYKWGNPSATSPNKLSWSESFLLFLSDMDKIHNNSNNLRSRVEYFGRRAAWLGERLSEILGEEVRMKSSYFRENCLENTGIFRLNRYPPCPAPLCSRLFGIIPHTDSSFLTFVYQDQVGGLQLLKDSHWLPLKPNPQALVVNIGDLFQAASNGVYKSVKHRVVCAEKEERKFTFREYKEQTHKDVKETGDKVGLPRFLISRNFHHHHLTTHQQQSI